VLCDAGFLVREVSVCGLKPVFRYFFPHKTFQEYFTVLHVLSLEATARDEWVQSLDVQLDESLIRFLLGVCKDPFLIMDIVNCIMDKAKHHHHLCEIFLS
jgi:hypothetical protein